LHAVVTAVPPCRLGHMAVGVLVAGTPAEREKTPVQAARSNGHMAPPSKGWPPAVASGMVVGLGGGCGRGVVRGQGSARTPGLGVAANAAARRGPRA
jgi:hypothetical protein